MSETFILNQPLKAVASPSGQQGQQGQLKLYKDFENGKLRTDSEIFLTEAERLRSYEHQIKEMRAMIYSYRAAAAQKHKELSIELDKLNYEREQQEKAIAEAKKGRSADDAKILAIKRSYLELCKERVSIANTINIDGFKKLEMEDRKSEAHDVFKWIIVTFYKEPVSKYYWQNFCEQVFAEDGGHDFKERLGKISAAEIKQEERVATESLLKNKEKYINHPDLKDVVEADIKKLVKIADLVMRGHELTKELTNEQKNIEAKQGDTKSKEEMAQKCALKANATKERVDLSQKYLSTLEEIDQSVTNRMIQLARKESVYSLAASEGHKIIEDLRSTQPKFIRSSQTPINETSEKQLMVIDTNKEQEAVGTKPPQPPQPPQQPSNESSIPQFKGSYNTQTEKRDECNCTLF